MHCAIARTCHQRASSIRSRPPRVTAHPGRALVGLARLCIVLLPGVLVLPALAQGEFEPNDLAELLSAGRHGEAYKSARRHRDQYEGDASFDLYYGVAALETGHLGEAVFALERVVMQRPSFFRGRLELARAYYRQGDHQAAIEHLEFILQRDPSSSIRASAEQYRRAIRSGGEARPSTVSGYLELGAGYDNNVASATDSGTVESLYGQLELEGRGGAGPFARVGAGVDIRQRLTPHAALLVHSAVEVHPLASRGDYSTFGVDHRLGVETRGERTRTRVTGRVHWSYIDGDAYRKRLGVRTDHAYSLSPETVVAAGTRITRLRYHQEPIRDSMVAMILGRLQKTWRSGMRPTTWASVFAGQEWPRRSGQAAAAAADRDIWGASAALGLALSPEWHTYGGLYYRRSRYERSPLGFDAKRDERYFALHLRIEREMEDWRLGPQVVYTRNDANLEAYGYDRTVVEVRARYSFR